MKKKNIIILVIMLAILLITITTVLAKYFSDKKVEIAGNIGICVLETETVQMALSSLSPEKTCSYNINISNAKENYVSPVNVEYGIKIKTTTNLPLEYNIYFEDEKLVPVDGGDIINIVDGIPYRNIDFNTGTQRKHLYGGTEQTHQYRLDITFKEGAEYTEEYSNILELIEIVLDSTQIQNN